MVAEGIPLGGAPYSHPPLPPSVVAANVRNAAAGGGVPHPSHGASVAQSPGADLLLHPAVAAAGGEGGAYFYSPQSSATNRSDTEKAAGALH